MLVKRVMRDDLNFSDVGLGEMPLDSIVGLSGGALLGGTLGERPALKDPKLDCSSSSRRLSGPSTIDARTRRS
jgi:hypothetical protein